TGGSGLIGTEASRFLSKNHDVTVFDFRVPSLNTIDFRIGNVERLDELVESMKGYDVVIHLAAALGVVNTEENPIMTLDINIIGTKNVLEACRRNDVKKIIFSSSSEIYGEPTKIPIEETDRVAPITTYGVSKVAAEEYLKTYSKTYGIKYTIFRFFNIYGADQDNRWVVPEFVSKAIDNKDIIIHGDGSQIRSFCYVTDAANALSYALEKGDNEIFNIGNDAEPISITELANRIILLADSKSEIRYVSFENSFRNRTEIMKRAPSIEKAKKILGYKPLTSLNDGIKMVIKRKRELK
ncbi:MAG: NAD-dependent epimerase/dehydratase family protein, partial [Nitrososphaerota archaeon]